MVVGDTVWIYPTYAAKGERLFYAFSSKDLVHWEKTGPVLNFADVTWIGDDGRKDHGAWAPGVVVKGGRFYFYYAVGNQEVTPSRIGVAVGQGPAGPFLDSGKALVTGKRDVFEAIDPMVFIDPKDGKAYLYAGGSQGARLRVYELNDDMVSIAREVKVETPKEFTEGAFLHERGGIYYLSYSHGRWRDASYSVHYATGTSPLGPFTYRGAILMSDDHHKGPGHHSFFRNPISGRWYIAYHRFDNETGPGPYSGRRWVAVDIVEFGADGLIKPVLMTDTVTSDSFGDPQP